MDDKIKIVLSSKDVINKSLDDVFINIELKRSFSQIKRERFDNDFDLSRQFRNERNSSRNFRVYGTISSTFMDCNNVSINIYSSSTLSSSNLISTLTSSTIGFNDINVFGKNKGKYYLELNNHSYSNNVWLKIQGNNSTFDETVLNIPLVFYDAENKFVEYGTETIDVGQNGNFIDINNNYPFFYNKHWIKTDISIKEVKIRKTSFSSKFYTLSEGQSMNISVSLDQPSYFGNESVQIYINPLLSYSGTATVLSDFNTTPSMPHTFNWSSGETTKNIILSAFTDNTIEGIEKISFNMTGNVNCYYGPISAATVEIKNV